MAELHTGEKKSKYIILPLNILVGDMQIKNYTLE